MRSRKATASTCVPVLVRHPKILARRVRSALDPASLRRPYPALSRADTEQCMTATSRARLSNLLAGVVLVGVAVAAVGVASPAGAVPAAGDTLSAIAMAGSTNVTAGPSISGQVFFAYVEADGSLDVAAEFHTYLAGGTATAGTVTVTSPSGTVFTHTHPIGADASWKRSPTRRGVGLPRQRRLAARDLRNDISVVRLPLMAGRALAEGRRSWQCKPRPELPGVWALAGGVAFTGAGPDVTWTRLRLSPDRGLGTAVLSGGERAAMLRRS